MKYTVKLEKKAVKALKKMDRFQARVIYDWIQKNLEGCDDPREHGKGLTGDKSGMWRYRVGACRIVADIQEDVVTILILSVGHRRDIYK